MQKIKSIQAYTYLNAQGKEFVLVRLESDNGIVGAGEATLCGHNEEVCGLIHQMIAPKLIGKELCCANYMQSELLTEEKVKDSIFVHAVSGIEIAAWDALGKVLGLPVYKLLGGRVLPEIPVISHYDVKDSGEPISYIDAYEPWEKVGLLPDGKKECWAKIASEEKVPLLARISSRWEAYPILEHAAMSILEADILQGGGISSLKQLATYAETYFIKVASRVYGGTLAAAASAQALYSCPNAYGIGLPEGEYDEILTDSFHLPKDAPGIGIDVNWDELIKNEDK